MCPTSGSAAADEWEFLVDYGECAESVAVAGQSFHAARDAALRIIDEQGRVPLSARLIRRVGQLPMLVRIRIFVRMDEAMAKLIEQLTREGVLVAGEEAHIEIARGKNPGFNITQWQPNV